jgi:hypothetical protein
MAVDIHLHAFPKSKAEAEEEVFDSTSGDWWSAVCD